MHVTIALLNFIAGTINFFSFFSNIEALISNAYVERVFCRGYNPLIVVAFLAEFPWYTNARPPKSEHMRFAASRAYTFPVSFLMSKTDFIFTNDSTHRCVKHLFAVSVII